MPPQLGMRIHTRAMNNSFTRAAQILKAGEEISVVGHMRPDADAIGSVTALTYLLRSLGKTVHPLVGQVSPVPDNLLSIPGAKEVKPSASLPPCDLVVCVDTGALDRAGTLADDIGAHPNVLVIDHHASNPGFGHQNLIEHVESTTVILHELFQLLNVPVTKEVAHSLYAGLMTDTGSFRWGRPQMHSLAASLVACGLDTRQIATDLLDATSSTDVQMIGRVLSGLQIREVGDHRVAILIADYEAIESASQNAVESLVDFVRSVDGSDVGALLKETEIASWAVSLRSSTSDMAALAVKLGGGGHVPAAGYTATGPRERVVMDLLEALKTHP